MRSRGDPDADAASEVAECVAMTAEALDQTRELSRPLRPTVLDLTIEREQLQLVIRDRDRGFEPQHVLTELEEHGGLGLRGIQERVGLVGGRTRLESAPGAGTTLHVRVLLNGRNDES